MPGPAPTSASSEMLATLAGHRTSEKYALGRVGPALSDLLSMADYLELLDFIQECISSWF
jgi:hypothetical protein